MRRLGRQLNVEAMSLYAYVQSRENLLDGVIAAVVYDLFDDPDTQLMDTASWQDYLVQVANGVRRSALAHPRVFPLVATRPPEAPWIRPPLRSLRWVESFLASLGNDAGPIPESRTAEQTPPDLADYPNLQRLRSKVAENQSADEFEESLDNLLNRLQDVRDHGIP